MTIDNSSPDNGSTQVTKQPYERPAFRYEKVFVTTALGCGKIDPTQASCIGHSKS